MSILKSIQSDPVKVTFLGTSHGVPSDTRHCSSILLEVGENAYLLDAGAPIIDILTRMHFDLTRIKALFNTHFHMDHIGGAVQFINLCSWYYRDTNFDFYLPTKNGMDALCDMISESGNTTIPSDRLRAHIYGDNFVFDDGTIRLEAIRTKHGGEGFNAFAFYIETCGKRILFTGDMSVRLEGDDFPKIAFGRHFDLIISECAHFPLKKLQTYIEKCDTDKFIITHVHPVSKIEEIEKIRNDYKFEVIAASDNDVFQL